MKDVLKLYVRVFMFLFPIVFLPISVDPFGTGKNLIIIAMGILGVLLWTISLLTNKDEGFRSNKVLLFMLVLTIWSWIGWWREVPGVRMRSLVSIGGVGTITGLLAWFFLWLQVTDKAEEKKQINCITAAGILTTITSIVVFLIPSSKMPIVWPKDTMLLSLNSAWSLTGSLVNEGVLLVFLVAVWGKRLLEKLRSTNSDDYMNEAVITALLTLALFLDCFRMFKTGWVNLDGTSGWIIAVEAFKRSPFFGIGPGNFLEAFNSYRPISFNATAAWANTFNISSNGILELWTELGSVGLVIVAWIGWQLVRQKRTYAYVLAMAMGLMAILLPMNLMGLVILTWILAVSVFEEKKVDLRLNLGDSGFNAAPWLVGLGITGVSVLGAYWTGRIVIGDVYMRNSFLAAAKNDGGGTYNLQIKAIGMNPYLADYRRVYSQTNLALASTILSNKDVSDDDKQKASVLVQQSVREAKAAISLDGMNPVYWSNLAAIYRQLIGVVDGSADWSFQAYQQAASLSPADPMVRLDMGGLLYAAARYDEADRVFEQVVTDKQDFANGWYNWAYTAKQTGNLSTAVQRLNQAVALVPVNSGDYSKASKELADWQKQLDEAVKKQQAAAQQQAAKQPETLKTAEPLPTTNPADQVNVPSGEMQPPTTDQGANQTIEATPTPKAPVKK